MTMVSLATLLNNGLRWTTAAMSALVITAASGSAAVADTTVRWLHIEQNPVILQIWKDVVAAFEKSHPGVKIEMQYLENEAFKAKLPTMLQSPEPPHIFYSWAGGVMHAQIDAGVLKDVTAEMKDGWADTYVPSAVKAFTYKGKVWGVPNHMSEIDFYYNKKLFEKAGIDAAAIKTWDDLLAAVKKLKAAGITPLATGGADKWPLHFYWVYAAMRIGGQDAFNNAIAGKDGGFASPTYVDAGKAFKQLVDLEPFQPGFMATKSPAFTGVFGDGKAAMVLHFSALTPNQQRMNAADQKGLPREDIGLFHFPIFPDGKGKATDTLGGINGWLVTKNAPKEAIEFLKVLTGVETQKLLASKNLTIPVQKGATDSITDPLLKIAAQSLSQSTYHQNFYDQDLGPSVGRVVNDAVADLATGATTPEKAAQQIQDAWELDH